MPRWANRLAKGGIIAVVLAAVGGTGWLAGNGGATPETPPDSLPAADLSPKEISVEEGTIVSRLTVAAAIKADPAVPVRPAKAGTVAAVHRKNGQRVAKGQSLLTIKLPDADPGAGPGSKKKPKARYLAVVAPVAGKVTELTATAGQEVAPSDTIAQLDRGRFQAVAAIDAKEVYRLYNRPESIRLAIDHGPAPFNCRLLAYGVGASGKPAKGGDGSGPDGGGDPGEGGGGGESVEVTCRVPRSQRVFAGIRGKMAITTDSVRDAVVIPLSAVLGENDKGRVTVVGPGGKREVRKVELGINDGKRVQVVDGLRAGEKILDRAPSDAAFDVPRAPDEGPDGGPPDEGPPDGGVEIMPSGE
ncbi:efflux RND transporter periplasmic adaptor subunit [Spirillospora sp. NPDC048911]|uniref:efflux RND transporter periplasmic adaptor subunit n=1 Tax=Spirillospora sp. NPDC048911 TaxID=3364527 RepID=UPI00371FF4A5